MREIRKRRNISVSELSEALDVSQQTLYKWENGSRDIPVEFIYPLAQFFRVSSDYLLNFHNYNKTKAEMHRDWSLIYKVCDYFIRQNSRSHRNTMRIILYVINEWDGDFDALVNMSGAYCAMPPQTRRDIAGLCLHSYKSELHDDRVDRDLSHLIELPEFERQCEALDHKTDSEFFHHLMGRDVFNEMFD